MPALMGEGAERLEQLAGGPDAPGHRNRPIG